jgi:hypothetical protein
MSFPGIGLSYTDKTLEHAPVPSAGVLSERQLAGLQWHAQQQADRIMQFWHGKGHYEVKAWLAYAPRDGFAVRSNLVAGLPPGDITGGHHG